MRLRASPPPVPPPDWRPCTRLTPRCDFTTWGAGYVCPECCTAHLREIIFFTEDLLTRHQIFHWLDYGSLLGAVRGGTFIPWDTDGDFGILESDVDKIAALEAEITAAGFYLDLRSSSVIRIHYSRVNTMHVDLFLWDVKDGLCHLDGWGVPPFPRACLDRLKPVTLYGKQFPAPADVHAFLADHRYGPTYMTPLRLGQAPPQSLAARALRRLTSLSVKARKRVEHVLEQRQQPPQFTRNLQLLHDVLATTSLADRYWVIGGLLIGWAREGRVLAHDDFDADFGILQEDHTHFLDAVEPLVRAGFAPVARWLNNEGEVTEYTFRKDNAKFEFFVHAREGDGLRCWYYYMADLPPIPMPISLELMSEVPAFTLAPMTFLDRVWQKPADHDAFLRAVYGDWRIPRPDYYAVRDDLSIKKRSVWFGSNAWPPNEGGPSSTP